MAGGRRKICSKRVSSEPIKSGRVLGDPNNELVLEYSAHGGFNNQRRCLLHAMLMSYALNRTLLVPPSLSHRGAPGYGSCPTSVSPPDAVRHHFDKASRSLAKARPSLSAVLSLEGHGVRLLEARKFYESEQEVSAAETKYDCTNTIWTFDERKSCRTSSYGRTGGCSCRNVASTLGKRREPVLRVGSTFKGIDLDSFDRKYGKRERDRLAMATLAYTKPFVAVAKKAACRIVPNCTAYASIHVRGSDGDFKRRVDSSITRALREVAKEAPDATALFVASDMSLTSLSRRRVFKDGLARFSRPPKLYDLKRLLDSSPSTALASAARSVVTDKGDAHRLANTPDLEMHLDILVAAHARLAFAGTTGSSMSAAMRTLRSFILRPPAPPSASDQRAKKITSPGNKRTSRGIKKNFESSKKPARALSKQLNSSSVFDGK